MDRHEEFLKHLLRAQPDLKAFIASMVRDRQAAEDLFQEACLALWQSFEAYDPARPFGAWARGVAAKKLLQGWEKARRLPLAFSPGAVRAILDAYDRSEEESDTEGLADCIAKLPERSRTLLALRYEQSMKLGEIARRVGGTLDAVHKTLSRVREALEACLRKRYPAENP